MKQTKMQQSMNELEINLLEFRLNKHLNNSPYNHIKNESYK